MSPVGWSLAGAFAVAGAIVAFLAYTFVTWGRRRRLGRRLLTVPKLEPAHAHGFVVPPEVTEVDFFLDVASGPRRWIGRDELLLRVTGPVAQQFSVRLDEGGVTLRRTLAPSPPGSYLVELVGTTDAELGELAIAGHVTAKRS